MASDDSLDYEALFLESERRLKKVEEERDQERE